MRDNLTKFEQEELNKSAILDAYVYLDLQRDIYKNERLEDIIKDMEANYYNKEMEKSSTDPKEYARQKECFEMLKKGVESSPELNDYRLVSQSEYAENINPDHVVAVAFQAPDENSVYVAYRGTGDGRWIDNGEGMYKDETDMQKAARDYFDGVIEELKIDENSDTRIVVTGHSKGGNNAQFVTLASKYAALVDNCYSFDGQGFSDAAIENFKEVWGEDYEQQLNKMLSVNGENDYVHVLGNKVISDENTIYIKTNAVDFKDMHDLMHMIDHSNGELKPTTMEQGAILQFMQKLNDEMMGLDSAQLEDCALTIMTVLEMMMGDASGNSPMGKGDVERANFENIVGFIHVGIPLILENLFTTKEGFAMLGTIVSNIVTGIATSENGILKLAALLLLTIKCAPALAVIGTVIIVAGGAIWMVATVIDCILKGSFTMSDFVGIIKAASIIALAPDVLMAALALTAVASLVSFISAHWGEIIAFVEAVGDWIVGMATTLYAWGEELVRSGIEMIKNAVNKVWGFFKKAKNAFIDLGNKLLSAAAGFFEAVSNRVKNFFKGVGGWLKGLFGSASSALKQGPYIIATISRIDELRRKLSGLKQQYTSMKSNISSARSLVKAVSSHYSESYVRYCCSEIEDDLKNAERYIKSVENALNKKARALLDAVESYRKGDREAVQKIGSTVASFY